MNDEELLRAARLALRMVAERYCVGADGALHSGDVHAHMVVMGVLEKTGDAERFEIKEHFSGQELPIHLGIRLKPLAEQDADMQAALNMGQRDG